MTKSRRTKRGSRDSRETRLEKEKEVLVVGKEWSRETVEK